MDTKDTFEGYITLAGLTVPKFIKMMGWSRSTYDRRMARPDTLTRGEIRRADYLLGFPDEIVVKLKRSMKSHKKGASMVKLTVENEEVKKEHSSRWIFAVAADPEGEVAAAIAFLGLTSPRELAETVGKSIGTQFKYLTGDTRSQIKLCKILSQAAIIAVLGNDIKTEEVEVDIKECGETSAED